MKLSHRLSASLLSLMLALQGCAPTKTSEGAGEYVDDSLITAKIKASIFNEPSLKSTEINVETFKGDVQLSGFVSTPESASRAVAIARGVKGVRSVRNDMHIK